MKIGRNDPCTCGSGRKYKHCCGRNIIPFPSGGSNAATDKSVPGVPPFIKAGILKSLNMDNMDELDQELLTYEDFCKSLPDGERIPSFMEFRGLHNQASKSLNSITADLKARNFESEEEMQDYIQQQMELQNNDSVEDFLGLSPAQMHGILNQPFSKNRDLVEIAENINNSLLETVPVIKYALFCFNEIIQSADKSKATQTGCFNRKFSQLFYNSFSADNEGFFSPPMKEADVPVLKKMRIFLEETKYIKIEKGRFQLQKKAEKILESLNLYPLYCILLKFFVEDFNWRYTTGLSELHNMIQRSSIFLLYIFKEKASRFISQQDFSEFYLSAFSQYRDDMKIDSPYLENDFAITYLFLEKFCTLFGLSEIRVQNKQKAKYFSKKDYKQSELFRKLFIWKV